MLNPCKPRIEQQHEVCKYIAKSQGCKANGRWPVWLTRPGIRVISVAIRFSMRQLVCGDQTSVLQQPDMQIQHLRCVTIGIIESTWDRTDRTNRADRQRQKASPIRKLGRPCR